MTQTRTSGSHRVLLVDDNEDIRAMMSAALARETLIKFSLSTGSIDKVVAA
jgi:CheY-like chemotaxis protein